MSGWHLQFEFAMHLASSLYKVLCFKQPRVLFAMPCWLLKLQSPVWHGCDSILWANWGHMLSFFSSLPLQWCYLQMTEAMTVAAITSGTTESTSVYWLSAMSGNTLDILQAYKRILLLCCLSLSLVFLGLMINSGGDVLSFYLPY